MVPVSFAGQEWLLTEGRTLFWPRERALLVADLHLEKASFYARTGQMLPPYDSRETLERLALAVRETGARRIFCLGDNFHDSDGPGRLEPYAAGMLNALTRATDWVWITGNHDHDMSRHLAGETLEELELAGIMLRHEAKAGDIRAEISGHFHPKLKIKARGRSFSRPCAVLASGVAGADKMILPAFGALTGGMDAGDQAIVSALQPATEIDALIATKDRIARFPLWRAAA